MLGAQATFEVELAGVEPATSWVRFRKNPSPYVTIGRRERAHRLRRQFASQLVAAVRQGYLTELDRGPSEAEARAGVHSSDEVWLQGFD